MGMLSFRQYLAAILLLLTFQLVSFETANAEICWDPLSVDEPTGDDSLNKGKSGNNKKQNGKGKNADDGLSILNLCNYPTPSPATPSAPGTPSVSPTNSSNGSYQVSWSAASSMVTTGVNAWGYQLAEYRGGSYVKTYTTNPTSTSYSVSGNSDGTYRYKVRGCNLDLNTGVPKCGSYSSLSTTNLVRHKPSTPSAPTLGSAISIGSVSVNWVKPSGAVTFYQLQRRLNNGSWSTVWDADINEPDSSVTNKFTGTSLINKQLTDGNWVYRVRACNEKIWACSSFSSPSEEVSVRLVPETPVRPLPSTQSSTTGSYSVSWGTPDGTVTKYDIREFKDGELYSSDSTTSRTYDYQDRPNGNYTYQVRACNQKSWACSPYSEFSLAVVVSHTPGWGGGGGDVDDSTYGYAEGELGDYNVGALEGEAGVSGGAATYNVPIVIPPGRKGMQPNISLNYSSRSGNGIAGVGWSLSAGSSIHRCSATYAQDGYTKDVTFSSDDKLCLDGQRLIAVNGTTYGASGAEYRTETDSFARITQDGHINSGAYFIVEHKNNRKSYYGYTDNSKQVPAGLSATLSWTISHQIDPSENRIDFTYIKPSAGEHYLSEIAYTGSGETKGNRRVVFEYAPEIRSDTSKQYIAGGYTLTAKRLQFIRTYIDYTEVRSYELFYKLSKFSKRSLLGYIEECTSSQCLPATNFDVYEPELEWSSPISPAHNLPGLNSIDKNDQTKYMDVNGDGLMELLYLSSNYSGGTLTGYSVKIYSRNIVNGEYAPPVFDSENDDSPISSGIYYSPKGDLNGDGITDFFIVGDDRKLRLFQFNKNFEVLPLIETNVVLPETFVTMKSRIMPTLQILDLNGDGHHDFTYIDDDNKIYYHLNVANGEPEFRPRIMLDELETTVVNHITQREVPSYRDVDGDGVIDIIRSWQDGTTTSVINISFGAVNPMGQFVISETQSSGQLDLPDNNFHNQYLWGDFNGDGLPDFIRATKVNGVYDWKIRENNGDRTFLPEKSLETNRGIHTYSFFLSNGYGSYRIQALWGGAHAVDLDSDGVDELLVATGSSDEVCVDFSGSKEGWDTEDSEVIVCGNELHASHATITGGLGAGEEIPIDWGKYDVRRFNWSILDFKQTPENGTLISRELSNVVKAPLASFSLFDGSRSEALQIEDLDNNGYLDFSYHTLAFASYRTSRMENEIFRVAGTSYYNVILRVTNSSASTGYFEHKNLMGLGADLGKLADTNYQVENGLGEKFKWSYAPLSRILSEDRNNGIAFYDVPDDNNRYVENDPNREHFYFTSSMYVVSNSYQSNGTEQVYESEKLNETQYSYREAVYNRAGRGFQGFRTIIVDDIESGIRSVSDFHQIFPLAGKLEKTRSCLSQNDDDSCQGNVLSESNYNWDIWRDGSKQITVTSSEDDFSNAVLGGGGNNRYWAARQSQTTTNYQSQSDSAQSLVITSDILSSRTASNTHDQYGNTLTSVVVEDNGFQITQKTKINTFDYDYVTDWWINKIKSTSVNTKTLSQKGSAPIEPGTDTDKSSSTQYSYSSDGISHRIPTTSDTTASGTTASYIDSTTVSLNGYGLPEEVAQQGYGNSNSDLYRKVTTTYSDDGYFPETVTNDAGHITTTKIYPEHGQPEWVTDANGNKVTYTYDAFGRVTSTTVPGGKLIETGYQWCSACPDSKAVYVEFTQQEGSPTVKTYKDMFNRTVMVETLGFDGSSIYTLVVYDKLGRKTFESIPSTNSLNEKGTHYDSYDELGRLLYKRTDRENGDFYSTEYDYDGYTTDITVTDGRAILMSRTYGGDGKLIQTTDAMGGVTRYAYDSMGNPITLQDANGNSIHAWHNGFGHKWKVDDPNMGVKTFDYNTFGEVEQEIDANNNKLTMRYDGLGRLTHRFVNDSETAQAHYIYDTRFKGKGLPATEVGEGIQKDFYYDEHSRPNRQVTTIDGTPYETLTEYDANFGRVKAVQYPASGIKVGYGYNDFGYQTTTFNADSGFVYQEVTARDAFMNITWALKNDGTLTEERDYSEVTGQLYTVNVTDRGNLLHYLDYDYASFGNLYSQTVNYANSIDPSEIRSSTEFYGYDDLHRLTESYRTFSNGHSETPIVYGYDLVGNLEKKSDYASTINYGATGKANTANAGPSAITSIIKNGTLVDDFQYDANGNLKEGDGKTIDYNAFNKPVRIEKDGIESTFAYGTDLMRFKQVKTGLPGGDETTIYLDKMVEIVKQGGSTITRTYIDDVAIISKEDIVGEPSTDYKIRFTLRDRLGSVVTLTDHNNHIMEHRSYDPFGKPRTGDLMDVAVPTLREAALSDPHSGDFMDNVPFTNRGFTDHEHLDDAELIHMNGRAYDYNLGRFLSVDPFIQSPGNSQSMNPYSYIMNNPLAGTDPSGYVSVGNLGVTEEHCGFMCMTGMDKFTWGGDHNGASLSQKRDAAQEAKNQSIIGQIESQGGKAFAQYWNGGKIKAGELAYVHAAVSAGTDLERMSDRNSFASNDDESFLSFVWGMTKELTRDALHGAHTYITGVPPEQQGDPTGLGPNSDVEEAGAQAYQDNALLINIAMIPLMRKPNIGNAVDEVPSPALIGNPYHPDSVAARQKDWQKLYGGFDPKAAAKELGYTQRIPPQKAPFNSHGQPVFSNGKGYITPDIDAHNVTNGWKTYDRKGRRTGTWNSNLSERIKD